ncbi:hypothetical protein HELRODRAFT_162946 [Helobdella robusta]|uniref:Uncharacterized protein n=1 Tax=Helobdella robusta TaxID=6412 RepID=T1ETE4_HELRO|nr:hypothetical protein HELRODRAFT_162946 [Helobdella robusta]ESN99399.1 hypothetical protein HELRODRAFT_162946 [Helobdella robusta]
MPILQERNATNLKKEQCQRNLDSKGVKAVVINRLNRSNKKSTRKQLKKTLSYQLINLRMISTVTHVISATHVDNCDARVNYVAHVDVKKENRQIFFDDSVKFRDLAEHRKRQKSQERKIMLEFLNFEKPHVKWHFNMIAHPTTARELQFKLTK